MEGELIKAAAYIGAGFVMGVGSIGPALGQGIIGKQACESIGKNPESTGNVRFAMILAMAIVESSAIYCFVIGLALIFFT